jgi:hypothetical protein
MTAFTAWASRAGQIGNGSSPPTSAVRHVVVKDGFGVMTNYGLSSVLCLRVATLRICRRRHEAADLRREQPGEFDRRRVFALRPDDLQADR